MAKSTSAHARDGLSASVDADGLDPADYPVPNFASLPDPAALADAEIKLSERLQLRPSRASGRVHWTRVSGDIFYELKPCAPADVLANLAAPTRSKQHSRPTSRKRRLSKP